MLPRLEKNVYISTVFSSIRVDFCTKYIKFDGFYPFRSVKFQSCYPCSDRFCPASLPIIMCLFIICLCAIGNFLNFPIIKIDYALAHSLVSRGRLWQSTSSRVCTLENSCPCTGIAFANSFIFLYNILIYHNVGDSVCQISLLRKYAVNITAWIFQPENPPRCRGGCKESEEFTWMYWSPGSTPSAESRSIRHGKP